RVRRVNLLAVAVSLWAVAMVACALAQTYGWLLLARLGLGAVTATAGPAIASLASAVSWRAAFAVLAVPAAALSLGLWRSLSEPTRGAQGQPEQRNTRPS